MARQGTRGELPALRLLHGRDEPPPVRRPVTAGELSATFEAGALRWIELDGHEVLHGIYGAVRDPAWGTVEPVLSDVSVRESPDLAVVEFLAEYASKGIDFRWRGRIRLEAPGRLTFEMDGEAGSPCSVARVGLCILHPISLAGAALQAETANGPALSRFPDTVEPTRWLTDLKGMRWQAGPEARAHLSLSGDLFEIEDQRNWTDGSYKTFSRPLRLPWPYQLAAGERVHQVALLEVTGRPRPPRRVAARPTIEVGQAESPMPALGTGCVRDGSSLTVAEVAILRELGCAHFRVVLDLGNAHWPDRLARARSEAATLEARLEIEAIEGGPDGWRGLAVELGDDRSDVARVMVFGRETYDTPQETLAAARMALGSQDGLPIGGGSRENFAELNRAEGPPEDLDVVGFPVCPQVHASDEATMLETLAVEGATARRARDMSRGRPVAVGPVTLRPLLPAAGGTAYRRSAADPRQMSLFAAGWLVGSVDALAAAGVDAATYFDAVGQAGFMDRSDPDTEHWLEPGAIFPAFHVFRALARGEVRRQVQLEGTPLLACAVRDGRRLTLLVANPSPAAQTVQLSMPGLDHARLSLADEAAFPALMSDPRWVEGAGRPLPRLVDRLELSLPRLAVAFLYGLLASSSSGR